jgi:hypothetical protein
MPQTREKVIRPERVVLKDGREGYFINVPESSGAIIVVHYPSSSTGKKRTPAKNILTKRAKRSQSTSSIVRALKEVKSKKSDGNYPSKDFDSLMDEL